MTDNPADSLRRELGAAVVATQRRIGTTDLTWQLTRDELVPDLVRVVTAALEARDEAARADERERAGQIINAADEIPLPVRLKLVRLLAVSDGN